MHALRCCSKLTRTFPFYFFFPKFLLATSGLGGGGRGAAAGSIGIDLVVIIGLEGGQLNGDTSAAVAARAARGATAAAAGAAALVIVIEIGIEGIACSISGITLYGGTQHSGSQSAQQLGDDAVRLLIDLLQQPVDNLGPNSGVLWLVDCAGGAGAVGYSVEKVLVRLDFYYMCLLCI